MVSLLVAIDFFTGESIPLVRDKHTLDAFIDFLKLLNEKYLEGDIIRIILDSHTGKKSKHFLRLCQVDLYLFLRQGMDYG